MACSRTWILIGTMGATALWVGACGDEGSGDPRVEACESSFSGEPSCFIPDYETAVLQSQLEGCAVGGACHSRGTGQSTMELDVTDPNASIEDEIAALIGQNGLGGPLLDTSCVDRSFLLTKLTANPGGGSRMPLGASAWSDEEIECFRKYLHDTFGEDEAL